jgi:hypothetical protein
MLEGGQRGVVNSYEAGGLRTGGGLGRNLILRVRRATRRKRESNTDLGEERHNQRMKSDRESSSLTLSIMLAPLAIGEAGPHPHTLVQAIQCYTQTGSTGLGRP